MPVADPDLELTKGCAKAGGGGEGGVCPSVNFFNPS